jgi:hypothetical protein
VTITPILFYDQCCMRPRNASAILSPFAHTCAHIADRPRRSRSKNASVYHPKAETSRGNAVALWRGRSGASETSVWGQVIKAPEFQAERQVSCRWPARSTDTGVLPQHSPRRLGERLQRRPVRRDAGSYDAWQRPEPITVQFLRESDGDKTGRSLPPASKCKFGSGLRSPRRNNDASADRHF